MCCRGHGSPLRATQERHRHRGVKGYNQQQNLVPHPLLGSSKRDALPRVPRRPRPRHGPSVNLEAREPLRVEGGRCPTRRARRLQISPIDIIHRYCNGRFVGRVADLVRRPWTCLMKAL